MESKDSRRRLKVLIRQYPGISASDAAELLGISRARVYQIAESERITFARRTNLREFLTKRRLAGV